MAYGIKYPIERLLERDLASLQGQIEPEAYDRIQSQVRAAIGAAKNDFVRDLARVENSALSDEMKEAAHLRSERALGAQLTIQLEVVRSYLAEPRTATH